MTETNAEQLKEIMGMQVSSFGGEIEDYELILLLEQKLPVQEGFYKQRVIDSVKWLIEQAELAQVFSKKNIELNEFLQGYSNPKNLGRNVIDISMDIIREQSERIEQMEMRYENTGAMLGRIEELEKENKRLRVALSNIKGEEEQNLEGYESIVYKIARQALEQSK